MPAKLQRTATAPQGALGGVGRAPAPAGAGNMARIARLAAVASGQDDRAPESLAGDGSLDLDLQEAIDALLEDGGKATPPGPQPGDGPVAEPLGEGATERTKAVHAGNVAREGDATLHTTLSAAQSADLKLFVANWAKNKARYEAVAAKAGVPAALVAALHWRESTGDFGTYLHQGDPLGKPAVHVPSDIPVFDVWEDAAVHALTMPDKASKREQLGIDTTTKDAAKLTTFSEIYNGLGYHYKDMASPYAWSGTSAYSRGKYVADGRFSATTKDQQLGTRVMLDAVGGTDGALAKGPPTGASGWASILEGRTLAVGTKGPLVEELQRRLLAAGQKVTVDGDFGPGTARAVKAIQAKAGLAADGTVGAETARAIDGNAS